MEGVLLVSVGMFLLGMYCGWQCGYGRGEVKGYYAAHRRRNMEDMAMKNPGKFITPEDV